MTAEHNRAKLCLVTAVDIEFKTAISLLSQIIHSNESGFKICQGHFGNRNVTVLQCGMGGRGFAEWLVRHLKTNNYEALIVIGLAGGLDPTLKASDVVIYDLCRDGRTRQDFRCGQQQEVSCDNHLVESLLETFRPISLRAFRGTGVTVSRIITDVEDKLRLGEGQQAMAVDMESFDILHVSAEFGLPAVAVRVISDAASVALPDFNSAAEASGKMNAWRLAAAMLRRPAASIRFLANLKPVITALRQSLQVVLRV